MKMVKGGRIVTSNVKFVFSACPPAAEGCTGILLPDNRRENAEAFISKKGDSVFAHSRKGRNRAVNQDSGVVFMDEGLRLFGVFDGYGAIGDVLSREIGDAVLRLCRSRKKTLTISPDTKGLLFDAVGDALGRITLPPAFTLVRGGPHGGSTGVVALILDDGRYWISAIGDSGIYSVKRRRARILIPNEEFASFDKPAVHISRVKLLDYMFGRNTLMQRISMKGINEGEIVSAEGVLHPDSVLFLVTDGVTKNLTLRIARDTLYMRDVSGCEELGRVAASKNVAKAGRAVIELVERRMAMDNQALNVEGDGVIIPQDDDMTLIAFRRTG